MNRMSERETVVALPFAADGCPCVVRCATDVRAREGVWTAALGTVEWAHTHSSGISSRVLGSHPLLHVGTRRHQHGALRVQHCRQRGDKRVRRGGALQVIQQPARRCTLYTLVGRTRSPAPLWIFGVGVWRFPPVLAKDAARGTHVTREFWLASTARNGNVLARSAPLN
jgi:hypothetical protein